MQNFEQALKNFVTRYRNVGLFSTDSRVVHYGGILYNVEGSTDDPDINGRSWKELLIRNGIDGDCYVTDPLPEEENTSHAQFNVGGHMTPNADGHVPQGGTCYLMPLCKWHNSTRRDGTSFEHEETKMLKLLGYMEGDLAVTFAARLPGAAPYQIISVEEGAPAVRPVDVPRPHLFDIRRDVPALPPDYLLLHRVEENGEVRFVIEDARFRNP